jgi:hypothetical protein
MLQRRNVIDTRQPSQQILPRLSSIAALALFAFAPLLLTSCGAEEYEKRLDNTRQLFAHMEMLDGQLHRDWVDPDVGVRLRLPLQFASMAASSGAAGGSLGGTGGAAPGAVTDDRQPKYMNIELPGLRGAFVARLKIIAANGAAAHEDGFVYVLTNHHLANAGDRLKGFHREVATLLSQTLRVSAKPEDERQETFPRSVGTFAQPVTYKSLTLNPTEPVFGVERQFAIYMYEQGDIQTVVLFVLPKDVDGVERLTDRIPLCLETLRITGDKPAVPAAGSSPATGKPAGF